MRQSGQHDDARLCERTAREIGRQSVGIKHDRLVLGIDDRLQFGLFERHPRVARQRQHHQDRVDFAGGVEQIDAPLQAAGVDALRRDVDRVARGAVGRQQFVDFGLNAFRQFGHSQALHRHGVRTPDAGAARHGENRDAIAPGERVRRQHRGDGDGLVEVVGDDEAVLCEYRVIGRRPAGHAGGVGGGGTPARA